MKNLLLITALSLYSALALAHVDPVEGGSLYLDRGEGRLETHRAEFDYAGDCELIAAAMNKAEPDVTWLCSTAVKPRVFECSISDIVRVGFGNDSDVVIRLPVWHFEMELNRGKARMSNPAHLPNDYSTRFDYTETDKGLALVNGGPYVDLDQLGQAMSYMTVDFKTSVARVLDSGMQENGRGTCTEVL